jgi:tetratricopeptide (TPR) repeat protein
MKWRDIIINAVVTLALTVASGVVVWLVTRPEAIAEKLEYNVENVATFTADRTKINFITVKLSNSGTKAAHEVKLVITFNANIEIRERQISISSGNAANYSVKPIDNKAIEVTLPSLATNEAITVSLLAAGSNDAHPDVSARSADTIAMAQTHSATSLTPLKSVFSIYLLCLIGALVAHSALLSVVRRFKEKYGQNNAAFIFLNLGFLDQAEKLLQRSIENGVAESIVLANYAAVKGLSGDNDSAMKLFAAAEWWSPGKHALAVIHFNKAVLAAHRNEHTTAEKHIREALSLNKRSIRKYCAFSIYIKQAAASNESFRNAVANT